MELRKVKGDQTGDALCAQAVRWHEQGTPALFVLLGRLGQDGWLAPGQYDVVEVHTGRASDVQTVDQLESGDAEGRPRKIRLVAEGKSDGEGAELRADPVTRIERSRDEHLHVERAETIDAQGLARNLTIASDPIAQALQSEELAVE